MPGFPDGDDIARPKDVAGRVAIHQHKVRSLTGSDLAAVVQMERRRGCGGGGVESFDWSEAGTHQQFQLAMDAGALRGSRVAGVSTGQNRNMRRLQLPHGFIGAFATGLGRQGEVGFHGGGLGGKQVWLEPFIFRQLRIEVGGANGVQDGQRRDYKDMMRRGDLPEIRRRRWPDEQVRQTIRARVDGVQRLLQGADVGHHQLAPLMRGNGQRLQNIFGERGLRFIHPILDGVVVDHFDVIRAFGNAGIHPRLGFLGPRQCGNRQSVLGAVASRGRGQIAGRTKVGVIEQLSFPLVLLDAGGSGRIGEHIEVGGHAEDRGLLEQSFHDGVSMGVDQTGE